MDLKGIVQDQIAAKRKKLRPDYVIECSSTRLSEDTTDLKLAIERATLLAQQYRGHKIEVCVYLDIGVIQRIVLYTCCVEHISRHNLKLLKEAGVAC